MRNNESYYKNNPKYSKYLEAQEEKVFQKYADMLVKYSSPGEKLLDVGCGTGILLGLLKGKGRQVYGVDVSDTSVEEAKRKGLNAQVYDGKILPFPTGAFRVVGSYNVLEHVDDPIGFLKESARAVRKGGYLIVACPNFLSITNSYHPETRGVAKKIINFLKTIRLLLVVVQPFEKMPTTTDGNQTEIVPDSDACNRTSPITIIKQAEKLGLTTCYWSCQSEYRSPFFSIVDSLHLSLFFGSSFLVFKKDR